MMCARLSTHFCSTFLSEVSQCSSLSEVSQCSSLSEVSQCSSLSEVSQCSYNAECTSGRAFLLGALQTFNYIFFTEVQLLLAGVGASETTALRCR